MFVPVEDSTDCITNNPDFRVLCLKQIVLRNVLITLNNVRAALQLAGSLTRQITG